MICPYMVLICYLDFQIQFLATRSASTSASSGPPNELEWFQGKVTKCIRDDPPLVIVEWYEMPDVDSYETKVEAEEELDKQTVEFQLLGTS